MTADNKTKIAFEAFPNKNRKTQRADLSITTQNMVVLSAAQGDETAYQYEEKRHGMFTYFLLKKLHETKGTATLGDLFTYIKDNVVKKSLVINSKSQTPSCTASSTVSTDWKNWVLSAGR